jgi:YggT family protein
MILIYYALRAYEIILLIRIILSWIRPNPYHPFIRFIYAMTDPVLNPIRRALPITAMGFDFSPIVVFIILELLQNFFFRYGYYGY